MEFAADLSAAITEHQFEVWYQPVVDLHDGSIVRAEALLRWRHPSRGLLRPNIFVPLLEQTGHDRAGGLGGRWPPPARRWPRGAAPMRRPTASACR